MGRHYTVALLTAVMIAACSNNSSGDSRPTQAASSRTSSPGASPDSNLQLVEDIYVLSPLVVQGLVTLGRFLEAYNSGSERAALELAADNVAGNDCDYKVGVIVQFDGKANMAKWLEARFADHDRLRVSRFYNHSGDPNVIGVVWSHRSNDYLTAHGFPNGITPKVMAKVVFDARNEHITAFTNAGGSGQSSECTPSV